LSIFGIEEECVYKYCSAPPLQSYSAFLLSLDFVPLLYSAIFCFLAELQTTMAASSSRTSNSDPDAIQKQEIDHLENTAINPRWTPGYGPLSRIPTNDSYLPAFGGAFQPGLYKPPDRQFANPAPLGLAGFALTTFLLSLINLGTKGAATPNIIVGPAFAYGGLIQLLAGMW
jgi:hypothetical protein